ncbi:hypothetical protein SOVF_061020 [Spinacia oleracea]|uniref:Uncharacterized protein isoform X1 n=1 Tax=Spinacia oleracea TaxID=3562 RepID=A0ABM3RDT8_SPIOL|nr:uncharacterized protein LOC110782016 isoform X1 [Spinacia oleracea]KNA19509.1 hypothetical protein SOVF_061020 [Spinacia oleracea]
MEDAYDMFKRSETNPALVDSRGNVPLPLVQLSRCFWGETFGMIVELKDNIGREISRGSLSWSTSSAYGWHDRRICSLIGGTDGYAAVHYSMFYKAIQAKLKVSFVSPDDDLEEDRQVCGRIYTRYTKYRYFTRHDKIYQSVLFEKHKSKRVSLRGGDLIALSKDVVAVPSDVFLIVKVDLRVFVDGKCVEKLRGKVSFEPKEPQKPKPKSLPQSIRGSVYGIQVSVEWG